MDLPRKTDAAVMRLKSLGIPHVYFNPPESVRLEYPCARFKRSGTYTKNADNRKHAIFDRYDLVYITYDGDDPMVHTILNGFKHIRHASTVSKDGMWNENFVFYL